MLQKLNFELRSAEAESDFRHFVRRSQLERMDCSWDDSSLAFAEQAIAEAEMRATEARYLLDEHTASCRLCSHVNLN
jgi:hypothetical protein